MTDPAYAALLDHMKVPAALHGVAGVLGWDQEVVMPSGGADPRAEQLAVLARLAHERETDPRVGEWLIACGEASAIGEAPDDDGARSTNLREWRRGYARATRMPADLVAEMAATESRAQVAWAEARRNSDFAAFRPWLEKVVDLQRQKARCLRDETCDDDWDALAEGFEPGMRGRDLAPIFDELRARIGGLLAEVDAAPNPPSRAFIELPVPQAQQEAFCREVADALGFDFRRGRLDRSTHPFTSGSHPDDVRITTRFADDNLPDALGSTVHEVGHGLYEQGLPAEHAWTPRGCAVSLGIHESQSRLWENQVMRSEGFWQWARYVLRRHAADVVKALTFEDLHRGVNRVERSLIRVEADEATYNLHIAVRFEIERALINGALDVADLPSAWNAAMAEVVGVDVPDDARGCLQDVHWSCGLFGYFPTYTLGNLYAAQFYRAAQEQLGDLEDMFSVGEFSTLRGWLREQVHAPGSRDLPDALCRRISGQALSVEPLMAHLTQRVRTVYGLT